MKWYRHPGRKLGGALVVVLLLWASPAVAGVTPDASTPAHRAQMFAENGYPIEDGGFPVPLVTVGEPAGSIELGAWEEAVRASAATWNDVPCSVAELSYAGHRDSLDEVGESAIPIVFASPNDGPGCLPSGLIGWTSLNSCDGLDQKVVHLNRAEFGWSIEPEPYQPYTDDGLPTVVDVESVVTHELGHVLGLSHSEDRLATMFASYPVDGGMRSLAVDDKLGVCSLYERTDSPPECGGDDDCPGEQTCDTVESYRLCHEVRGVIGDSCGLDNLICEERCLLTSEAFGMGYCTQTCTNDDVCGDGFVCEVEVFEESDESYCVRAASGGDDSGPCSAAPVSRPTGDDLLLVTALLASFGWWRRRFGPHSASNDSF